MTMQQYCLRWNNHQPNFISVFSSLLNNESLVDVTLAAEGKHLQAHKVVLSACSSYFQSLFTVNPCQHPIVILKDVKFLDLKIMVDFMYYGEVNVSQEQLPYILKTAEMLKIKGLAEIPVEQTLNKTHNSSMEKAELLTPQDSNWSAEGGPVQSSTPSPCPLSPGTRRKRLRKSSSGSGSGERPESLETQHQTNELLLGQNILGTVIKTDPGGYSSDSSNLGQKSKQHSGESADLHRGSSHESGDSDTLHQITLQVPQHQQQEVSSIGHSLEAGDPPADLSGTAQQQQQSAIGLQWNVMDQTYYGASCSSEQPPPLNPPGEQAAPASSQEEGAYQAQIGNSPPQILKRKRSLNPQSEENFIKALEAVRFGGIGFCKAARMYGVNNRTLWLEYKKRGYPNFRLSIKNRKQEQEQQQQQQPPQMEGGQQLFAKPPTNDPQSAPGEQIVCATQSHPVALISGTFFEGKPVDLGPALHRPKYLDPSLINAQGINFHSINFEQM
ncbi:longitudinals lacking protein, isoforms H/M/V isoform X2 [Euwallacea similis]|uniref:longitudinals lacking protein, isoforms H/M/V isoform X2 n=1 Tax=Euwallacea similis TaxID=1736056 RepID=UPI00344D05D8